MLFNQLLYPRLKIFLKSKGLQNEPRGSPKDCFGTSICQDYLKKALSFRMATMAIYPALTNLTEIFLSTRPDFYLGRFLSMFSDKLNIVTNPCLQFDGLKAQITNLVSEELMGFLANLQGCYQSLDRIMNSNYETFVDIIKFSQVQTKFNLSQEFETKFVNSTAYPIASTTERPRFLPEPIGMIPFCDTASKSSLSVLSASQMSNCSLFDPVLTAMGLCYSFNSQTMQELYKTDR
jgi:hypothetical protein